MSPHPRRALAVVAALVAMGGGCGKVPLDDVNAAFLLADATWFEAEQTLFVFYRVQAEQGIGDETRIEIAWRTDDEMVDFTPLQDFAPVHTHLPVDCGVNGRCGSMSIHVPLVPRDVRLQLRYHEDGAMVLPAATSFNVLDRGPAAQPHRSLVVYGVLDQENLRVQWRSRHVFPAIRNEEATALGLRRRFEIAGAAHGADLAADAFSDSNPYGYGALAACSDGAFTDLGWQRVATVDRATWSPEQLPLAASASGTVCAVSSVTDALGTFDATAFARKNAEVQQAFPVLHSPITVNVVLPFFLKQCAQEISDLHERVQRQRLLIEDAPVICVDDFDDASFAGSLAATFRAVIDDRRGDGADMILVFALHHDDDTGALAAAVQTALLEVLPAEASKASPRATGAFVYDTFGQPIADPELSRLVLWCPADLGPDLDNISDASLRSCPLLPDAPDLRLGPFRFNSLPILPTREQLVTFVSRYSEEQAGRTLSLTFKAPVRTTTSLDVPDGPIGMVTYFNEEVITTNGAQSFSFCAPDDPASLDAVRFRSTAPEVDDGNHRLDELPQFHEDNPSADLDLGIAWDSPFLTRMTYQSSIAGAVTAVNITIPFGVAAQNEAFLGAEVWDAADFPIGDALLRCTRFCDHPTFDSAGVYNVQQPFDRTYLTLCYRPAFPGQNDGFPHDP